MNFRLGTLFGYFGYEPNYRNFNEFFVPARREEVASVIEKTEAEEPGKARQLMAELNRMLI